MDHVNVRDCENESLIVTSNHWFKYKEALATFEQPMGELFLTEQMSLEKGLQRFGKERASAVVKELRQLEQCKTIDPVHPKAMTKEQKRQALRYLMYLKEK